jgi:hypothetical protein
VLGALAAAMDDQRACRLELPPRLLVSESGCREAPTSHGSWSGALVADPLANQATPPTPTHDVVRAQKVTGSSSHKLPANNPLFERGRGGLCASTQWLPVDANKPADARTRKTCICRPFVKRLKDSNPRPSAWQAVDLRHLECRNACKSAVPGGWTAGLRSGELCADTGGLDNERTMSGADGGRDWRRGGH